MFNPTTSKSSNKSLSNFPEPAMGPAALESLLLAYNLDKDSAALAELGRKFGYQPNEKSPIPMTLVTAVTDWVRVRFYKTLPPEQGFFEIGKATILAYRQTVLGRILMASIPILPLNYAMKKIPGILSSNVNYGTRWIEKKDSNCWELFFEGDVGNAHGTAGMLTAILELLNLRQPKVTVVDGPQPTSYKLILTWQE